LFFDAVFHVATGAVERFVLELPLFSGQLGACALKLRGRASFRS
jgi:hypothetical protein